jgi:LacI family transcriptional regulator
MAATVRDVARKAGVSAMTVSRVVNDQPGVSSETRKKIEAAIAELNYAPSKVAGSLTSQRTELLGMIVPDVSNPFFGPIVRGAETAARKAGYRLLLCNSESDLRLEKDYVSDLVEHRVEGLLIAPVGDKSAGHLGRLVDRRFPVVLLDRQVEGLACDSVTLDNVDSARRLAAHLISVGHRRIAMVTDADDVSTGRERLQGFKDALADAAIPFVEDLVFHTTTDQIGGYRAAQLILGMEERPTAIFAVNNMTAVGVIQALRQASIRVPEEISLVCFDDVQHLAVISPFLTVMDQPAETMARVAMQLLLERIAGNAGRQPRTVTFPGELIVRQSCGIGIVRAAFSERDATRRFGSSDER